MSSYSVFWAKGSYIDRQLAANREGCVAYVEHHFNALLRDNPESWSDNPSLAIVASNAGARTRSWAADYTRRCAEEFGTRNEGVIVGPQRGNWNVFYAKCPSVLVEPLFVSDPGQAAIAKSPDGQERLASVLVDSIRHAFPGGGTIGFSVGHKYRSDAPHDRGAPVHGGGTEADLAEAVLLRASVMLLEGDR